MANNIKKEPTPSTSATHFWKQNKIEEQPGWLQHLLATASGSQRQLRRSLLRQGTPVTVRRWTLGKRTLDPHTLLRLPACTAAFEKVEQEREVLRADPVTTVSDQLCCILGGGGPMANAAKRPRSVWIRADIIDSNQEHSPLREFLVS